MSHSCFNIFNFDNLVSKLKIITEDCFNFFFLHNLILSSFQNLTKYLYLLSDGESCFTVLCIVFLSVTYTSLLSKQSVAEANKYTGRGDCSPYAIPVYYSL